MALEYTINENEVAPRIEKYESSKSGLKEQLHHPRACAHVDLEIYVYAGKKAAAARIN